MNNEEKILQLLEKQGEMIGQINGRLDAMDGRLDRLEATQKEMQETITQVAITQENIVLPRLGTLTDGHTHLVKTLASKEQAQKIAEDVEIIKDVVKHHRIEINELKKAQ